MSIELFQSILQGDLETAHSSPNSKRPRESLGANENIAKKNREITTDMGSTSNEDLKALIISVNENLIKKLDEVQNGLQLQLTNISQKVQEIEEKQATTSSEVEFLKDGLSQVRHDTQLALNKIEQKALELNVVGYGIPSEFSEKKDQLVEMIGKKLDIPLELKSFESINFQNNRNAPTCTYFFKFNELSTKSAFMKAVDKVRNKDIIPLEDFFPDLKSSNLAGKPIAFRNQITKVNQKILEAGKKRIEIKFVWERNGKIWLRRKEGERAVEALSVEHVNYIANSN